MSIQTRLLSAVKAADCVIETTVSVAVVIPTLATVHALSAIAGKEKLSDQAMEALIDTVDECVLRRAPFRGYIKDVVR